MRIFKRNLIMACLFSLCLYGLYSSAMRGNANAWYFKAEFALNEWAKVGKIADQQVYIETLEAITKAQRLDPNHPHYAHMLGRITHWGVDNGFANKEELVTVKGWYVKATDLRPLWPDPWVDLARLNNALFGYNLETQYYLKQALNTGPFIDLVTIGTLQVLLLNWSDLSGSDRKQLFDQFEIATRRDSVLKPVLKFAKEIGREKLVCLPLKFKPEYKQQKASYLYNQYCQ